jgi:DASS family divalent anion:Na+ symporter
MIMNLAQIIDNTPYLNIMHPTHRSEVVSGSEKIIMVKDSVVFTEDAKGDFVYFIANGEIVLSNSNGQVIKKAGESFGEEIYLGSDRYLSTAKAIEDTTIYLVPKSALMPSNLQESRIANGLFTSFIKQYLKIPIMFGSSSVTTGNTTSSWSDVFGWFFTLIIPVITYYALAGSQITEESRLFLSFLGCSISMWMFRLFPEFIPGLFLINVNT